MFDYNSMIQRAIEFFPTWSDIRKRYKTSAGGKLLSSTIEEICELEGAIGEYKKYYFLDNYEGHEDDIMAFSYKYAIGIIDINTITIKYDKEDIEITENINELLEYNMIAYYELGNIYLHDKIDSNKVEIYVNDDKINAKGELVSVWNIFDEFACFVDIERHSGEKNSELVNRILHRTRYKPNASIEGLQNAIMTELLTEFPDITRDEIQIEQVNDINLRKAYKDFNTLLDFLNSLNADVYRWKRWDLNVWQHDFKSISYIPAVWDESITNFKNGIGYGDDCKPILANNSQSTNATITLYDKSKETMNKYLADKKLERDITIKFKKYNDVLNQNLINYTIKASRLTRLYPEQIVLDAYQETSTVATVPIEKIFKHGHNIESNKSNSIINDVYPYRLKFEPKDNNKDIKITKCKVYYIDKVTNELSFEKDLIKEKPGFMVNSFGNLVSNSIKRSITRIEDFDADKHTNFQNVTGYSGIKAIGAISTGSKTLYNLGGQTISYKASCEMSDITSSSGFITFDNTDCRWEKNNILFYNDDINKKINVKLIANKFTFDVLTNNTVDVMVRYSKTGPYQISKATIGTTWSTEEFAEPKYMEIIITTKAKEEVKVGKFKYCNYNVEFHYKIKDNFIKMTSNVLPINNIITLRVTVTSKSGGCPIISGIYIGSDISNTVYVTDVFDVTNNCYRQLDIESNCKITLIKRNINNTRDDKLIEDYDPTVSYKATDNDSYIRLNLDEYNTINNITTTVGQIQRIEESGKMFYNIALSAGQEIKSVVIDGTKNESSYRVSLLDMINRELDDYTFDITTDRVYCSKLVKGVVVLKNNDGGKAKLLKLSSSLLHGVGSTRFTFNEIPSNIGVIWGFGESYYSNSIVGSFDYITFYSESDRIHTANNTYNLFINEIKDVPIAENFTEPSYYDKNALNFYTVECNSPNTGIRFYNYLDENKSFDDLSDWSVGIKNLYIKNTSDYNNEIIYDVSSVEYSNKEVLAEYINLQDSYEVSNNNTIFTEQYIVIPPEGMSVQYKKYDGTTDTKDLLKTEVITIDKTMFKKLTCSNVDKITYVGKTPPEDNNVSDIKYTLLKDEGIIVWNEALPEGLNVYVQYIINKPVALVFDLDLLYKLTGYAVETYRELNTYYLLNMNNGETYDLNNFSDFSDSDLAYIECEEPSFEGQMINDHTVKFNKHVEEKTVLVKTGYYYFNGREYYLFSEDGSKTLYNNKHLLYDNVDISDDYIYTYKATNNFVRNSEMLLRNINDLYNYDCNNPIESPKFNKYTACDSYNDWITFNTTLVLTDMLYKLRITTGDSVYEGFNDVALQLVKKDSSMINYAYLDITDYIKPETYITLAATSGLKVYIGEEQRMGTLKLKSALSVSIIKELKKKSNDSHIRTDKFLTKNNTKYYLIITGEGIVDDIVISDKLSPISNYHVKNIEKLGFVFNEVKAEGSEYKMKFNSNYNSINNRASLCSDGNIRIVGNISWNATKIKTYETAEDFDDKNCYKDTELIVGDYVKAPNNSPGRFITDYVEIDPSVVNRLFVKVNDILIDKMDKFKITILSTDSKKTPNLEILTSANTNYAFAYGSDLFKYVKAQIEIPEDCVIDKIEILVEYKSSKENAPILVTPDTGHLISPVYDSQQSSIYSVKNINIKDISNINDVEVYIRAMTDNNTSGRWMDWNKLELTSENGKVVLDTKRTPVTNFRYTPVRFFQFKIVLKSKTAYIKFDSLDIEVIS